MKLKPNTRKALEKKLDTLWSLNIRAKTGNRCEVCNSANTVQAHHIMPRTHKGTRWDLENGVALCRKHHLYWAHRDAIAFTKWVTKYKTEAVITKLEFKAYSVSKWTEGELEILFKELNAKL